MMLTQQLEKQLLYSSKFQRLQSLYEEIFNKKHEEKTYLNIYDHDKNGKIILDSKRSLPAKSLCQAWIWILQCGAGSGAWNPTTTILDTTDVLRSVGVTEPLNINAAASVAKGLVVGTSSTASTITNNKLLGLIAHGVGAGQLQYGAHALAAQATVIGNVANFKFNRALTNSSGATITVKEVGLYGPQNAANLFLIERRVIPDEAILTATTKTFEYEFKITH